MEMVTCSLLIQNNYVIDTSHLFLPVLLICPDLNNPQNGQVMVDDVNNFQGSNATYSCNIGFELIGGSMRVCENTGGSIGDWSGSDPTCQRRNNRH